MGRVGAAATAGLAVDAGTSVMPVVAGGVPAAAAAAPVPVAVPAVTKVHGDHRADQQDPQPVGGKEPNHGDLLVSLPGLEHGAWIPVPGMAFRPVPSRRKSLSPPGVWARGVEC